MPTFDNILFVAKESDANERIDRVLARLPEIGTRSRAEKLLELGHVKLASKIPKSSHRVRAGEIYEISIPIIESSLQPYPIPLDIIYEDSELLVVNKPAGLVVHPGDGHEQDTLVNALIAHAKDLSMGFHEKRPGIVHRIDRDTSGLLVVAKNDFTHEHLASQFKNKTAHRVYWAIVFGVPKASSGRIQSKLARHPTDRKRFASTQGDGKVAITHFNLRADYKSQLALLHLKLETGRTHQIRVHLSEMGHPIIGDVTYGADKKLKGLKSQELAQKVSKMNRFALHAAELGFKHPKTGETLLFCAPWPDDLIDIVVTSGFAK